MFMIGEFACFAIYCYILQEKTIKHGLISVIYVEITSINSYQPLPFHILYFANMFQSRILIYAG